MVLCPIIASCCVRSLKDLFWAPYCSLFCINNLPPCVNTNDLGKGACT